MSCRTWTLSALASLLVGCGGAPFETDSSPGSSTGDPSSGASARGSTPIPTVEAGTSGGGVDSSWTSEGGLLTSDARAWEFDGQGDAEAGAADAGERDTGAVDAREVADVSVGDAGMVAREASALPLDSGFWIPETGPDVVAPRYCCQLTTYQQDPGEPSACWNGGTVPLTGTYAVGEGCVDVGLGCSGKVVGC